MTGGLAWRLIGLCDNYIGYGTPHHGHGEPTEPMLPIKHGMFARAPDTLRTKPAANTQTIPGTSAGLFAFRMVVVQIAKFWFQLGVLEHIACFVCCEFTALLCLSERNDCNYYP